MALMGLIYLEVRMVTEAKCIGCEELMVGWVW